MTSETRGYVLVTAARDEARVIERTIESVARQTRLPTTWVVVNDNSSDATEDILREQAARLPWLTVARSHRAGPRSFVSKAAAVRAAYEMASRTDHGFVAHLDADIELPPDYYERCLERLAAEPRLGITGGAVIEGVRGRLRRQRSSSGSVAGGVQVFRRACWSVIGDGYLPLEGGGEDAVAEVLARANGFAVAVVPELAVVHHGPVLGGAVSVLRARVARGRLHWQLGYRPLFQLASAIWRTGEQPLALGSLATVAGYGLAAVQGIPRTPPPAVVASLRAEQRARLRSWPPRRVAATTA